MCNIRSLQAGMLYTSLFVFSLIGFFKYSISLVNFRSLYFLRKSFILSGFATLLAKVFHFIFRLLIVCNSILFLIYNVVCIPPLINLAHKILFIVFRVVFFGFVFFLLKSTLSLFIKSAFYLIPQFLLLSLLILHFFFFFVTLVLCGLLLMLND